MDGGKTDGPLLGWTKSVSARFVTGTASPLSPSVGESEKSWDGSKCESNARIAFPRAGYRQHKLSGRAFSDLASN